MATSESSAMANMEVTSPPGRKRQTYFGLVSLAATVQFAWFYVTKIPPYMNTVAYENGTERTPFQYRFVMAYVLHWAHGNSALNTISSHLGRASAFFPEGLSPEQIIEAALVVLSIAVAGAVAKSIYKASSRTGVLTPVVYPLTLVMVATTYGMITLDYFRFPYDLTSLALFSVGLYLIYFRRNPLLFSLLFAVATLNRETSLFLLVFFGLSECLRGKDFQWRALTAPRTLLVFVTLGTYWIKYHTWAVHRFSNNHAESLPHGSFRIFSNLGFLLTSLAWPQMLSVCAYSLPFVLFHRRLIPDGRLKLWLWVLPGWFLFMLFYGVVFEVRIYGELIAYFACLVALVTEEKLIHPYLSRHKDPLRTSVLQRGL